MQPSIPSDLGQRLLPIEAELQAQACLTSVPLSRDELDAYLGGVPARDERLAFARLRAQERLP